uniref:Uncharacterized protein n=1 Tax=Candidatus Methanophagaceae archaeon ANME-1 ERB6 TaxID=2759912 RepID=A0A7G9Z190_9EURY|nr:hypothetical protein KFAGBJAM_00005 [Methanosarcinales archaeon ANME-1 ERB6]
MKKRKLVTLMILMLTAIMFSTLFFSTPAAGSDELKRELLEEIISLDKPELFDDYGELYLAKAKTQAVMQGMEGKDVTWGTKEWVDILLGIIDDFEGIAYLSESSAPSDHIEAIENADGINISINALSGYIAAEDNEIPMLSEHALERFYRGEGEFFENLSRNEKETKVKIEYENISSFSYKKGGIYTISDASRMEFASRRDEWIYKRDMERASEFIDEASSHLYNAKNPPSGFFGDLHAFMDILKARDSFEKAKKIYEKHEDKELGKVEGIENEIKSVYHRLMLDTLKIVAIYLLILSFFTVIIWKDFKRWGEELDDTRLGEELIV